MTRKQPFASTISITTNTSTMTAYLPGVRINLLDLINNQKPDEPPIDLEWEPTKAKIDNFLFAV
jgi:hypothetical protein